MKKDANIDYTLVEAYKAGDQKALPILVKRWHKFFCEKAYWLVKDKDVAKDIAQESWVVIIEKIEDLKESKQFKFWAFRIVCNKAMDWLRSQSKSQQQIVGYETKLEGNSTSYSENEPLKMALSKGIQALPIKQQTVIRLFYVESYSLKQISIFLNISQGTVKSRLFHAREKLKKVLINKKNTY